MKTLQQIVDDALLERYVELDVQIKLLTKEKEEIKQLLLLEGPINTNSYVCSINDRERVGLKGLKEVAKIFGMDLLEEYELVSKTIYKQISVSRKDERL